MTKVTAVDQLESMIKIARDNFSPERFEKVEKLFEIFVVRMVAVPAFGTVHFNNTYSCGYLDNVPTVIY